MFIQSNIAALMAGRSLGINNNAKAKSAKRLSSGFRINSAVDDAAGLAISEKMRAQIRGLDKAERNAQDGIGLVQTADGALSQVDAMITRIRELAVQAINDTNSEEDRRLINEEINQMKQEINMISERTSFNNKILLNGQFSTETYTVPGSNKVYMGNTLADAGISNAAFSAGADPVNSGYDNIVFTKTATANVYDVTYNNAGATYTGVLQTGDTSLTLNGGTGSLTMAIDSIITDALSGTEGIYEVSVPVRTHEAEPAKLGLDPNAMTVSERDGLEQPNALGITGTAVASGSAVEVNDGDYAGRGAFLMETPSSIGNKPSLDDMNITSIDYYGRSSTYTDNFELYVENYEGQLDWRMVEFDGTNKTNYYQGIVSGNTVTFYENPLYPTPNSIIMTVDLSDGGQALKDTLPENPLSLKGTGKTCSDYGINIPKPSTSGSIVPVLSSASIINRAEISIPFKQDELMAHIKKITLDPGYTFEYPMESSMYIEKRRGEIFAVIPVESTSMYEYNRFLATNITGNTFAMTDRKGNTMTVELDNFDWLNKYLSWGDNPTGGEHPGYDLPFYNTDSEPEINISLQLKNDAFSVDANQTNRNVNVERQPNGNLSFSTDVNVNGTMTTLTGTASGNAGSVFLSNGSGVGINLSFPTAGYETLSNYLHQEGDTYTFEINIDANREITMGAPRAADRNNESFLYNETGNPLSGANISLSDEVLFADDTDTSDLTAEHTDAGYVFKIEVEGKTYTSTYASFPEPATLTTGDPNDGSITVSNLTGARSHLAFKGDTLSTVLSRQNPTPPYVTVNDSIVGKRDGDLLAPGTPLWLQTGANTGQIMSIEIESVHSAHLGKDPTLAEVDVLTPESGTQALKTADAALNQVVGLRGKLGAYQNRLEYTIRSLQISGENLSAAESRIRDADMAKEMMSFTKSDVVQQAGISVLTQANQTPQMVLQLLR